MAPENVSVPAHVLKSLYYDVVAAGRRWQPANRQVGRLLVFQDGSLLDFQWNG